MQFLPLSWSQIFQPEAALLDLIARGSVIYLVILVIIRFLPRRTGGEMAIMDLIFVVLVAEAASHSMGDYNSVPDGLIVVATLMFWDYFLNFLSYHVPAIERLLQPPPLAVVRNGRLVRRNMRKELMTEDEMMEQLRREGIDKIGDVKIAYVESDGEITVIRRKFN